MRLTWVAVVITALGAATASPAASDDAAGTPCHAEVRTGVLPTWARSGFSGPKPRIPHSLGRSGEILGILFGHPLRSPPEAGRNNKILWVAKESRYGPALWIRAQLMNGVRTIGAPIRKIVPGGPGPSIVDLPSSGCWRLTLSWSGHRDSLDLRYSKPSASAAARSVVCTADRVGALVARFVAAFNDADLGELDQVFAKEPDFEWYSTDAPGERLTSAARDRASLVPYFRDRHAHAERLTVASVRHNGGGNFEYTLTRIADDLQPSLYDGKGAARCYRNRTDTIFVWSMGRK